MTRIAVDLLGEGLPSGPLLDALPVALDADPRLVLTLVAPAADLRDDLARLGIVPGDRVVLAGARQVVPPGPEALREVRARRASGVRVAARLVRDGHADAMVSVAPPEAVLASAQFTYGLVPGATRASLAAIVGSPRFPMVLCDAGAATGATADELAQVALLAAAYASVRGSVPAPRVGLLAARPALPDAVRTAADELLRSLDLNYAGQVRADELLGRPAGEGPAGGRRVDVVVTDGFTGDVLLSILRRIGPERPGAAERGPEVGLDPAWGTVEDPDVRGGTIVLGVDGVAVHAEGVPAGASDGAARGLLMAVRAATSAVRGDLGPRTRVAMAALVARRRTLAGLIG